MSAKGTYQPYGPVEFNDNGLTATKCKNCEPALSQKGGIAVCVLVFVASEHDQPLAGPLIVSSI